MALSIVLSSTASAFQANRSEGATLIAEGVQLLRGGQAMQAKAKFDEAVIGSPSSADALTWRGITENQLQQYDAAESDFEAALKLSPAMLSAHYNLALSLIRLKKIDAAIEQLRLVVSAQPDSVQSRYNLAILLEEKALFEEAVEELSAAHTTDAADKGVTLHLLQDQLRLGHIDAIGPLEKNLADPATPPDMQRDAAKALVAAGRYSDAVSILERAREDPSTGSLLARILLVADRADEANEILAKLPSQGEDGPQIIALKGVGLAATHKNDEAVSALKKALEQDPSLGLAYNVLGFCLFQQGKYTEAAEAYGSASKLEPTRQLYARDAALAYERANQPAHAIIFAERAAALGQSDANGHLMLGKLYASANRSQDAVRELLLAAEQNPDLDSADYLLARTYMKLGDAQQAAVWSGRFSVLKQKHEADLAKASPSSPVRSSTLLTGGSLTSGDAGEP